MRDSRVDSAVVGRERPIQLLLDENNRKTRTKAIFADLKGVKRTEF